MTPSPRESLPVEGEGAARQCASLIADLLRLEFGWTLDPKVPLDAKMLDVMASLVNAAIRSARGEALEEAAKVCDARREKHQETSLKWDALGATSDRTHIIEAFKEADICASLIRTLPPSPPACPTATKGGAS